MQVLSLYLGALDVDSLGMGMQQKVKHPNTQDLIFFFTKVLEQAMAQHSGTKGKDLQHSLLSNSVPSLSVTTEKTL